MAYKRGTINNNNNIQEITKNYFSSETLGPKEEQKQSSKRFTIKNKEEKKNVITLRLTDSELNDLVTKVEKSGLGSVSNYIRQVIKRGL